MFTFIFVFFCFAAMINTIQGQEDQIPQVFNLTLLDATNPRCEINETVNQQSINLCLAEDYQYQCTSGGDNNNEVSLICTLTNSDSDCHTVFISDENDNEITLDCSYSDSEPTNGNDFDLEDNQCMYSIYFGAETEYNETQLLCNVWVAPIVVTTFNNTQIFEETPRYYTFPLFGFKVNKRFVKSYGIAILVAIIVVSCLVAICCYGLCSLFLNSMKDENSRRKRSKNDNHYDMNRKMPQSNGYNI